MDLGIGIASGDWETIFAGFYEDGSMATSELSVEAPFEEDGRVKIYVIDHSNTYQKYNTRIAAIDHDGKIIKPGRSGSWGGEQTRYISEFFNTTLDDISEFRFQIRTFEWAEFENVALRPSEAAGVDGGIRYVFLPDVDTPDADVVLDLASGELLPLVEGGEEQIIGTFSALGKGDLAYDRILICMRGAKAQSLKDGESVNLTALKQIEDARVYTLEDLPYSLLITTAEGEVYGITVLSKENNGIHISYANAFEAVAEGSGEIDVESRIISVESAADVNVVEFLRDELGLRDLDDNGNLTKAVGLSERQVERFASWVANEPNANILATPNVRVLDRQSAEMVMEGRIAYIAGYEVNDDTGQSEPIVKYIDAGFKFSITPELQRDRNLVKLDIDFKQTDIPEETSELLDTGEIIESPIVNTTSLKSIVAIRQGDFILMQAAGSTSGGLITQGDEPDKQFNKTIFLLVKVEEI